jgi:hypothetical protein
MPPRHAERDLKDPLEYTLCLAEAQMFTHWPSRRCPPATTPSFLTVTITDVRSLRSLCPPGRGHTERVTARCTGGTEQRNSQGQNGDLGHPKQD